MDDFFKKEVDLIDHYNKLKPLLFQWGNFIDSKLLNILIAYGFDTNRIQIKPKHRIKEDKSLISRAFYRDINSSDPLKRIEDKVGTRIVVTTIDDVLKIREIVKSESQFWSVRESRGIEKYLNRPKEFDYQSLHLNLTPTNLAQGFNGLSKKERDYYVCELQVRTLLQHAFAEVAHDTIYKGAFGADSQLVRILSRGMALMEATDEYFCRAYEIMEMEETYERTFLDKLIAISNDKLEITPFQLRGLDSVLTESIFNVFDVRSISISDVERTLITNKTLIEKTLNKTQSYLRSQPIIILIIHLIISNTYLVRERWYLEEEIIKDLFFKLGFSMRK